MHCEWDFYAQDQRFTGLSLFFTAHSKIVSEQSHQVSHDKLTNNFIDFKKKSFVVCSWMCTNLHFVYWHDAVHWLKLLCLCLFFPQIYDIMLMLAIVKRTSTFQSLNVVTVTT